LSRRFFALIEEFERFSAKEIQKISFQRFLIKLTKTKQEQTNENNKNSFKRPQQANFDYKYKGKEG